MSLAFRLSKRLSEDLLLVFLLIGSVITGPVRYSRVHLGKRLNPLFYSLVEGTMNDLIL